MSQHSHEKTDWHSLYKLGGAAAICAVLAGISEIAITFLPDGNAPQETALTWFLLFQQNPSISVDRGFIEKLSLRTE